MTTNDFQQQFQLLNCAQPIVSLIKGLLISPFAFRPSPQLKEASIDSEEARLLYREVLLMMRTLYRQCRLVHADLSEYNLMSAFSSNCYNRFSRLNRSVSRLFYRYHCNHAYLIDVSQSVEHDHPNALEFLRRDCSNINGKKLFFARRMFSFLFQSNVVTP